jgi:hypothetical protein
MKKFDQIKVYLNGSFIYITLRDLRASVAALPKIHVISNTGGLLNHFVGVSFLSFKALIQSKN